MIRKPLYRLFAGALAGGLVIVAGGAVAGAGDSSGPGPSTAVYESAAEDEGSGIDNGTEAIPGIVLAASAAARGLAVAARTRGFRSAAFSAVRDVTRIAGVFPFAAPVGSPGEQAETLLDR